MSNPKYMELKYCLPEAKLQTGGAARATLPPAVSGISLINPTYAAVPTPVPLPYAIVSDSDLESAPEFLSTSASAKFEVLDLSASVKPCSLSKTFSFSRKSLYESPTQLVHAFLAILSSDW